LSDVTFQAAIYQRKPENAQSLAPDLKLLLPSIKTTTAHLDISDLVRQCILARKLLVLVDDLRVFRLAFRLREGRNVSFLP
jgi:hypothetical protein